jgi:uncharacterized protein YhdP
VKRRGIRVLFWIVAGLIIVLLAGGIVLLRSIDLPRHYRDFIEARLREEIGSDVRIGRARMRLLGGLGIEFRDLVIKDPEQKSDFIRVRRFILQMRILPLLRRQVKWKSLILEKPSIYFRGPRRENLPVSAKGKGGMPKIRVEYSHVSGFLSFFAGANMRVRGGEVHFIDESVIPGIIFARIENLAMDLGPISMDAPIPFGVRARQPISRGIDGRLSIAGELRPLPASHDLSKMRIAAEVRAKNVNPHPFWRYYGPYIPIQGLQGFLDIHAYYEGDFSGLFRSWGQITVREVGLDYSQVFDGILKPKKFSVEYDLRLNRQRLVIPDITFRLPEIEIRGRCTIREIRSPGRRIDAFATTGSFRFDKVRHYLPFRIMSSGLARILGEATSRGKGRVVSFRINGPIRDFAKLGDRDKADLIYGKMRLENLAVPFAEDIHPIGEITGWVTLEDGALRFLDLKGSLGRSRLIATGMRISRIYSSPRLDLAVGGSIDMEGIVEIAQKAQIIGRGFPIGSLSGEGDLRLKVAAKLTGPSELNYNGHLLLEGADLTIKGVTVPVAAISGKVIFSQDQVRFTGLRGQMGNSVVWINGRMENPWNGQSRGQPVSITMGGELDLGECLVRLFPRLPSGISQAMASFSDISGGARLTIKLKGKGNGLKGIRYEGRVVLENAIFRHPEMASSIHFLKGEVRFTPHVVRFTDMEARSKGSYLRVDGSVRDYHVWKRARVDLGIRAASLDIGDFRITKRGDDEWMWKGGIALPEFGEVTLRVKEGRWRYTDFSNLTADITVANGKLNLDRFHCDLKEGTLDATAWLDLARKGEMAFALNPTLSHGDGSRFFKDFGLQERLWITGGFNLGGSLMGRGSIGKEIRRSLEGKFRVEMEKGRIRRWRILSKVFSVLNVLQLFKGRLPELRGEGMPYNRITADIGITQGIVRTENLLVDSDAMRITVIGEADVAHEDLDVTVGLRPLGTVDAIVSNVPVVGRILAGEDEAVIAYYVEVKGDFSNPKVKHIPLKSMGRGLLGMIKRVLETPIHAIPMTKEWVESGGDESIPFPEDEEEDDSP